jgi:hypothetical protein
MMTRSPMREFGSCLNFISWLASVQSCRSSVQILGGAHGLHYVAGWIAAFTTTADSHDEDHPRSLTFTQDLRQIG